MAIVLERNSVVIDEDAVISSTTAVESVYEHLKDSRLSCYNQLFN